MRRSGDWGRGGRTKTPSGRLVVSLFAKGAGGDEGEGEAETSTAAAMAELARAERRSIVFFSKLTKIEVVVVGS